MEKYPTMRFGELDCVTMLLDTLGLHPAQFLLYDLKPARTKRKRKRSIFGESRAASKHRGKPVVEIEYF
jgi:hypothetical protein